MGSISEMWSNVAGPNEVQEAVIDAVCATILFDDEVSEDEGQFAVGFVASMLGVGDDDALRFVDDGLARLAEREFGEIVDDIAARLPQMEHRKLAFLAAVGASRVDSHEFSWGEEELIDAMADVFGFSDEERAGLTEEAEQIIVQGT